MESWTMSELGGQGEGQGSEVRGQGLQVHTLMKAWKHQSEPNHKL